MAGHFHRAPPDQPPWTSQKSPYEVSGCEGETELLPPPKCFLVLLAEGPPKCVKLFQYSGRSDDIPVGKLTNQNLAAVLKRMRNSDGLEPWFFDPLYDTRRLWMSHRFRPSSRHAENDASSKHFSFSI
jgi:hypothetical protein